MHGVARHTHQSILSSARFEIEIVELMITVARLGPECAPFFYSTDLQGLPYPASIIITIAIIIFLHVRCIEHLERRPK